MPLEYPHTSTSRLRLKLRLRAVTRVDVLAILAIIVVTTAVLIVSLARRHELTRRITCTQNLKEIGAGLWQYAETNDDGFPIAFDPGDGNRRVGMVDYTQAIGSYRGCTGELNAGSTGLMPPLPPKLSTTRSLWLLFRMGHVTRDKFVCPSTMDKPNNEPITHAYWDFGDGDIAGPTTSEQSRQGYRQVSYGYVVWGGDPIPGALPCGMAVVADKSPFGAAIEAGHPAPPQIWPALGASQMAWKPFNSPNHGGPGRGQGQAVLCVDGTCEFQSRPYCGWGGDNIYTQWGDDPNSIDRWANVRRGNPPTLGGCQTPAGETDSLIYP